MSAVKKSKAPGAARRRAAQARLADALAGAAWAEADRALIEATTEFNRLAAAKTSRERKEAMFLLGQALQSAARKRGLAKPKAKLQRTPRPQPRPKPKPKPKLKRARRRT